MHLTHNEISSVGYVPKRHQPLIHSHTYIVFFENCSLILNGDYMYLRMVRCLKNGLAWPTYTYMYCLHRIRMGIWPIKEISATAQAVNCVRPITLFEDVFSWPSLTILRPIYTCISALCFGDNYSTREY